MKRFNKLEAKQCKNWIAESNKRKVLNFMKRKKICIPELSQGIKEYQLWESFIMEYRRYYFKDRKVGSNNNIQTLLDFFRKYPSGIGEEEKRIFWFCKEPIGMREKLNNGYKQLIELLCKEF